MAEELVIPVTFDLTPGRQQLQQELQEVSRGTTLPPPRGAAGLGRVTQAEQASIDHAHARVNARTPAGTYALPGGYFPQGGYDPNGWRNVPQATEPGGSRYRGRGNGPAMGDAISQLRGELFGGAQQRVEDLSEQASMLSSATVATQRTRQRRTTADGPGGGGRRGRGGFFALPTSSVRGLIGLMGVTEIGNAIGSIREGDSRAQFAESSAERELIQAEALSQATSGFIGSTLTFLPDLVDSERWSPARRLREAREGVERRNRVIARNSARAERSIGVRAAASEILSTSAEARTLEIQGSYARERQSIINAHSDYESGVHREIEDEMQRINAMPGGTERELATLALKKSAKAAPGRIYAKTLLRDAQLKELRRVERVGYFAQDRLTNVLEEASVGRFGSAAEGEFEVGLANAQDAADERGGSWSSLQRRQNMLARKARAAEIGSRITSRNSETSANTFRLSRGPEVGAQLIGLADQMRQEIKDAPKNEAPAIRQQYAARAAVMVQQFRDERFETGQSLDAANRQSRFRQMGGSYRIDAALDQVTSDAAADVRELRRRGDTTNIGKRNTLAVNQIRELRSDYFRSIQFEEVSGGRIAAGSGNPFGDTEKKFRDAERGVGKETKGGMNSEKVPELLQEAVNILQKILDGGMPAIAG